MNNKLASAIAGISCWNEIHRMYQDPRRAYHGVSHVSSQLNLIAKILPVIGNSFHAANFLVKASLFHDCFYEVGLPAGFNEQTSAEIFKRYYPDAASASIYYTILATAHFDSKLKQLAVLQKLDNEDLKLAQLFLDIDLHTFQNPEDGKETQAIVREAVQFGADVDDVAVGRKKFLAFMQPRFADMYHVPYPDLAPEFDNQKVRELHLK